MRRNAVDVPRACGVRAVIWTAPCGAGNMNHNSLIIAADGLTARLFRIAQTNDSARPVELIDVGACTALGAGEPVLADARVLPASRRPAALPLSGRPASAEEIGVLARRIAERAGAFGEYHLCNPVIVVASRASWPVISYEVERKLPHANIRPVYCEMVGLEPQQILERLQDHKALGIDNTVELS